MSRLSPIRVREFDLSSAPGWNGGGPLEVLELSPPVDVERRSAMVEATVQPGVSSKQAYRASSPSASFEAPAVRLMRMEDALLETRMCIAVNPRVGFVAEPVRSRKKLARAGYVVHGTKEELTFPERETVSVDFHAVTIASSAAQHNYFHWMFETVGGLLITREFVPSDARVVVSEELEPFEAETLAAVGIDPDSVFVLPPDRFVHFPELYILPRPCRKSAPPPILASVLRRLVGAGADSAGPRRIYITRQRAERRRIINHDEVGITLARHGFSEVTAEALSVQEQIALFAQAEAIVGIHGAGLTNAVFSPPGTLLVELQPELRKVMPLYWNLAAIAGLRYVQIVCKSLTRRKNSDARVDCSSLDATLRRQLPRPTRTPG